MFTTKTERSNPWPTSAVSPSATTIETSATSDRQQPGHDRAEDEQEDDQRDGQPELELALLQVLLGERREVAVGGELAGDGGLEAVALGGVDDLDHPLDRSPRRRRRSPIGITVARPLGRDEASGHSSRTRC